MSTISEGASNAYSDAGAIPPSMNAPISSVVSRPSASASAASNIRTLAASTSSRDSAPSPLTSTRATMVRSSADHPEADYARQLMRRPRHWATVFLRSGDRCGGSQQKRKSERRLPHHGLPPPEPSAKPCFFRASRLLSAEVVGLAVGHPEVQEVKLAGRADLVLHEAEVASVGYSLDAMGGLPQRPARRAFPPPAKGLPANLICHFHRSRNGAHELVRFS